MRRHNGFTMLELLFVIVILGIVGAASIETVRQYYDNIYRTQEYSKRVAQADHMLEQVSKYFEDAISSSIVNLDRGGVQGCFGPPQAGDNNDYTVAFLAVDRDALNGDWNGTAYAPGWSEDTVLNGQTITSLESRYDLADQVLQNKGSTLFNSVIYNKDSADTAVCARFNWNGAGGTVGYHFILNATPTTLTLANVNIPLDGMQKYLISSGYAFVVDDFGDFRMYDNFHPWFNERYDANVSRVSLLGQGVASFRVDYNAQGLAANANVLDRGLVWRLKLCMRGLDADMQTRDTADNEICRERMVHVRY